MGGRDSSYQAHLLWNQLPVWVHDTDTLSTFHIRLQSSSLIYAATDSDCEEPFMMHWYLLYALLFTTHTRIPGLHVLNFDPLFSGFSPYSDLFCFVLFCVFWLGFFFVVCAPPFLSSRSHHLQIYSSWFPILGNIKRFDMAAALSCYCCFKVITYR